MNVMEINKAVSEMSREQLTELRGIMKRRYNELERVATFHFQVGDQVTFTDIYGDTIVGTVVKINPKLILKLA